MASAEPSPARRARLPAALAGLALTLAGLVGAAEAATEHGPEPLVLAVVLNAHLVSDGQIVYRDADSGGFWIEERALAAWRLRPEAGATRRIEGRPHHLLCGAGNATRCSHDTAATLLTIEAAPERIDALRLARADAAVPRAEAAMPSALYVNYDLFGAAGSALDVAVASAYAEARSLSPAGEFYLRAGWLGAGDTQRLVSRAAGWSWDWPATQRTLTVGGFVSEGSVQRGALGIVGARYESNAALRPELNRLPRPVFSGDVARPSRAELFVDGLFRRAADVPYGRFEFEADGLLAGAGELQMVLTDARGEQTTQRERYYVAPQLLAPGLAEFALEAGSAGPDLALLSTRGAPVVAAERRQGVSDTLTLGGHVLAARGAGQVGISADHLLRAGRRPLGVARVGASVHDRGDGPRARWLLGHEYQDARWGALLRAEWSPRDRVARDALARADADTASLQRVLPTDRQWGFAGLNLALDRHWQLGASVLTRQRITGERSHAAGLTATWRSTQRLQISATLQTIGGARRDTLALIGLVTPLGRSHLGSVSAVRGGGGASTLQWSVQSLRDPETNDGSDSRERQVRMFGQTGPRAHAGASIVGDERFGQWAVEAASGAPRNTSRVAARIGGAFGLAAGRPFVARRIDDGFILVDGDGQAGLPVFLENRFAGVTDASGHLLLTGARAWQANRVSVDSAALPIEYTLAEDQLQVVPRSRALALARFEVSDGGELIAVRRADGSPLPAGARVLVSSQRQPAAVNSRSEVFLQRAGRDAQVEVQWPGGHCRFDYRTRDSAAVAASGGVFLCA